MTARDLAQQVSTLFSLPEVTTRLTRLLESPFATNGEIGEVVINDPALTARLLRLANSNFYGLPARIEMVSEAIALLGRDALRDLVLATSVTSTFRGIPAEWVDMERFWFNSVACGVIARSLAFRCRIFESEPLFVAGLLHKVGRLAFYSCCPDDYRKVLESGGADPEALERAEREVFGFTHAELGAELLRSWGLPERLQYAVAYYPAPNRAPRHRRSAAIVHVAEALAAGIEPGTRLDCLERTEHLIGFDKGAWNMLELSVETIPAIMHDAWIQAFEIFDILRPGAAFLH